MKGLWFLHYVISFIALYQRIKFHLFIFNSFRDMLRTSLLLQKLGRKITLKLLVIELRLSMYQVSLNSLLYFQRCSPGKLFTAKNKKGSNSVNTGDRVMVLALFDFHHGTLSVYQVSLSSILLEICSGQNCDGRTVRRTDKAATICSPFGEHKK